MKKLLISALIFLILVPSIMFAETSEVNVIIPDFDVNVNGAKIDTEHSQYPVISYRNITYFPMTSDYLAGIGLDLKFSSENGLNIDVKNEVGVLEQKFLGAFNTLGSSHVAQIAPFPVKVNGTIIDNNQEVYPVLLYKNITYFPMTWRFAVTEFGWTTSWDESTGFGITVKSTDAAEDNLNIDKITSGNQVDNSDITLFDGYTMIEVDGGDLSGNRKVNVVVDIGFGDREYYAFTNEYGQLVKVIATEIVLQDESTETVLSTGRYYYDEAKVPGTESVTLDEGHVIADSLGGVANAYNITPQNSILNRHGDQAYMEKVIRDANGCTDFEAIITYPNTETQIPSHYKYTYTIMGNVIVDEFANVNPDEVNADIDNNDINNNDIENTDDEESTDNKTNDPYTEKDLNKIDTNGNGRVTIAEAEAAGFSMPIYSSHWLYKYMTDRDGDGMVGE